LVLDRTRLQQRLQMVLPLHRPEPHEDEEIGARAHGGAEDLREAQVVADKGRDGEAAPLEGDDLRARFVDLRFSAEAQL